DHPYAPIDQFAVADLHVHHLVILHQANADHDRGRNHVEDKFLCSSAFHTGTARYKFRSYDHLDGEISIARNGRMSITYDASGDDACRLCGTQGTNHVRCGAAGGNANYHVFGSDVVLLKV